MEQYILMALLPILGGIYRMIDGRHFRPNGWNVWLFAITLSYCIMTWGWLGVAIAGITIVNLLAGYKSFTWPWVVYNWKRYKFMKEPLGGNALEGMKGLDRRNKVMEYMQAYEKDNGFHTWHTAYRFLIPSLAICALTSWNFYYLGATVIAGALFPLTRKYWNTEPAAWIREFILGAVLIGGLAWM